MNNRQVINEFLEQLRSVLATTIESVVNVTPAAMSPHGWRVRMTRADQTVLTVTFDADGAAALAGALHAGERRDNDSIADAIQELCSHTIAALGQPESGDAPAFELGPVELLPWQPAVGELVAGLQAPALSAPLTVAIALTDAQHAASAGSALPSVPVAQESGRLGVIMDIDLPLVVRFGFTEMPLKTLAALGPGSLIPLARAPEDPVEVIVGGRVVAHGEVVVVDGSYGVRIVDRVGEREPARRMEV
jgi:flagellar motor switch protein FliN